MKLFPVELPLANTTSLSPSDQTTLVPSSEVLVESSLVTSTLASLSSSGSALLQDNARARIPSRDNLTILCIIVGACVCVRTHQQIYSIILTYQNICDSDTKNKQPQGGVARIELQEAPGLFLQTTPSSKPHTQNRPPSPKPPIAPSRETRPIRTSSHQWHLLRTHFTDSASPTASSITA